MIRRLRIPALIAGSCVLAVALAELGLRRFWPVSRGWYVLPPGLDTYSHADPVRTPGVEGPARMRVNSDGLRGGEIPPRAEHVVLAIGGSTTECLLLDEPETWPGLLERAGETRFGAGKVWVGNAGRSGHTSREHVLQLERVLANVPRIDRVIVLVGVNDLSRRLSRGDEYPAAWRADPLLSAVAEREAFALRPLEREPQYPQNLALYRVAKLLKLRWQSSGTRPDAFSPHSYEVWRELRRHASRRRDALPDLDSALVEYRANLRALIEGARGRNVRVLFLTQPAIWRADLPADLERLLWMGGVGDFQRTRGCEYYTVAALAEGMRRYNAALMETCAAEGVECIDLAAAIPTDGSMFYDDVHFTEAGARRVAEAIAPHVWR